MSNKHDNFRYANDKNQDYHCPGSEVVIKNGNDPRAVDNAMKKMKRKLSQEGVFHDARAREHFVSNTEKRRRAHKAAVKRERKRIYEQENWEEIQSST